MLALKNDRRVRATLMWENTPTQQDRIDDILDTTRLKNVRVRAWPEACRMARSSGWKSACCWHGSRNCFSSTSLSLV